MTPSLAPLGRDSTNAAHFCLRFGIGEWQAIYAALRLSRTLRRARLRDKPGGLGWITPKVTTRAVGTMATQPGLNERNTGHGGVAGWFWRQSLIPRLY